MWRTIVSRICACCASVFLIASLITQWGYSEIFSTNKFVETANTVITEPIVQDEIAAVLVESLITDIALPPFAVVAVKNLATRVVATESFGEFWSNALRAAHEPLVAQLLSDTPVTQLQAQRINLEPLVQSMLDDLRTEFPQIATLLPETVPNASFDLLSGESLQSARDVASLVQRLRWIFPAMTVAFLTAAYFAQLPGQRRIRVVVMAIASASFIVFLLTRVTGSLARSFVSDEYSDMTTTIADHIVKPLATQSLILLALCAVIGTSLFVHARRTRTASAI